MLRLQRRSDILLVVVLLLSSSTFSATVTDDFTQPTDSNNWSAQFYACLTAGTAANNTAGNSKIPGCNYGAPDAAGQGALRLTPASGNQHGAIVSNYTFPSNQGLDVTFTTYAYGGSKDGLAGEGADGLAFFLMDGAVGTTVGGATNLGAWGGSLAYSCSNVNSPFTGLTGAYLGLGMDEYGNFLNGTNGHDNTATGIPVQTTAASSNGYNTFTSAPYQQANRIGLRGAGNVSWYWLNANYPNLYPSSLSGSNQQAAVQNTCKTGTLWNYSGAAGTTSQTILGAPTVSGQTMTVTLNGPAFYVNGDAVTFSGLAPVALAPVSISSASLSGTTLTVNASTTNFAASGQTVTIAGLSASGGTKQSITATPTLSGTTMTVKVPSTSGFANAQSVSFTGLTASPGAVALNGAYTISSVTNGTTFKVTLPASYTGISASSATTTNASVPAVLNGAYTVTGVTGSSFTVTYSGPTPVGSITASSATAALPAATIAGAYTIANVATAANTSFTVTLNGNPASVTNTSANATDSTRAGVANTAVAAIGGGSVLMDYPVIPGGYWVLPNSQLIANEAVASRNTGATPAWPITYKLRITPAGILNYYYSYNGGAYQPVLTNWPITTANGPLPANFRFGFAGSTGGSTNVHEITCFTAQPTESSSSASANTVQSGQVRTGTQVYLASYDPNAWFGSLVSDPITVDSSGVVSISASADWDANCSLTGGSCSHMGGTSVTAQGSSSRTILTWNGTSGVPFEWANLTSAQKTNLGSTASPGTDILQWIRGARNKEQSASPAGALRARSGVLGDIVNSSPVWIGPPSKNYGTGFVDLLHSGANPETSYVTFKATYATRQNVVYIGANDGMLHGFQAGANNTDGSFNASTNHGQELIGYVPSDVLASSNIVNLTNPGYGHQFSVDATPGFGDLFYNGAWHTWLVSGVGSNGSEIFALNVTDPTGAVSSPQTFAEADAANLVLGDWTASTITCGSPATACGANLGNTVGTPLVRRLHNGQWAVIFGNGLNSASGKAGVYVGLVSPTDGSVSFSWFDTGWTGASNGINYVSSGDLDGDFVTDYLYAGDVQGNVWRFDMTNSDPTQWGVSKYGQPTGTPLFVAKDSLGNRQPITSSIAVTATLTNGAWRVLLGLGTGRATPFTSASPTTYQSGRQTIYGIWDWDMAAWNGVSATPYAQLPEISTSPYRTSTRSQLYVDTLSGQTASFRSEVVATVCWADACATSGQYGWLFDLPDTGEQQIYNPVFSGGELLLNTTIPPSSSVSQCTLNLPTGWSMAFNIASGGGEAQHIFPDATGNLVTGSSGASITGAKLNAVGTPYIVSVGTKQYTINQTAGGTPTATQLNAQGGVKVKRVSWEQLR